MYVHVVRSHDLAKLIMVLRHMVTEKTGDEAQRVND